MKQSSPFIKSKFGAKLRNPKISPKNPKIIPKNGVIAINLPYFQHRSAFRKPIFPKISVSSVSCRVIEKIHPSIQTFVQPIVFRYWELHPAYHPPPDTAQQFRTGIPMFAPTCFQKYDPELDLFGHLLGRLRIVHLILTEYIHEPIRK